MEGLSRDIGPGLIDHCVGEGSGIVFRVVMGASRQTDRNTNTLTTGPQINTGGENSLQFIFTNTDSPVSVSLSLYLLKLSKQGIIWPHLECWKITEIIGT